MSDMVEEEAEIVKLPLFTGYGLELEYMIVDKESLNVLPITDQVFHSVAGAYLSEINRGEISWTNEVALHVLELKTTGPVKDLKGCESLFQDNVRHINTLLANFDACFMPTAMHPWMNPFKELRLWPHSQNVIYETYHKIFNCQGHGWANLQSAHINLPFANDEEFSKLHAAIRFLMPLMPALAASSPIVEEHFTDYLDNRLNVYMHNQKKVPSITGKVIPETVFSRSEYEKTILAPMYRDISVYDTDAVLQDEWLNSRGAIARFERYTIEIRVLDVQECPQADVAIAKAICEVLKDLVAERYAPLQKLHDFPLERLHAIFLGCVREADQFVIEDAAYLRLFGIQQNRMRADEVWQAVLQKHLHNLGELAAPLKHILSKGCLARRIEHACKDRSFAHIKEVYRELCNCLQQGRMFG